MNNPMDSDDIRRVLVLDELEGFEFRQARVDDHDLCLGGDTHEAPAEARRLSDQDAGHAGSKSVLIFPFPNNTFPR